MATVAVVHSITFPTKLLRGIIAYTIHSYSASRFLRFCVVVVIGVVTVVLDVIVVIVVVIVVVVVVRIVVVFIVVVFVSWCCSAAVLHHVCRRPCHDLLGLQGLVWLHPDCLHLLLLLLLLLWWVVACTVVFVARVVSFLRSVMWCYWCLYCFCCFCAVDWLLLRYFCAGCLLVVRTVSVVDWCSSSCWCWCCCCG